MELPSIPIFNHVAGKGVFVGLGVGEGRLVAVGNGTLVAVGSGIGVCTVQLERINVQNKRRFLRKVLFAITYLEVCQVLVVDENCNMISLSSEPK